MIDRSQILSLRGAAFRPIPNKTGGHLKITIQHYSEDDWPGEGAEGFAFPVVQEYKGERREAIMKAFISPLPERAKRTKFFVNEVGLVNLHDWMFDGAPYVHVYEVLNGVHIEGHVARWVGRDHGAAAQNLSNVFETDLWTRKPVIEKRTLALQLADAVNQLETEGIVHGDLSANNLMIGPGPNGQEVATLIDYDGFYAPGRLKEAPPLPVSVSSQGIRTFGTVGMQYPELCRRFQANDLVNLHVETDRFALAALACTLVAWTYPDAETATRKSGRARLTLLDEQIILSGNLAEIDPAIIARFPEGFALLEEALQAQSIHDMPSAEDWVRVLGGTVRAIAAPVLQISRYVGRNRIAARPARLISDAGDLSKIDQRLSAASFRRNKKTVELEFDWPAPVFFWDGVPQNDNGRKKANFQPAPNQRVSLRAGQEAFSNGWRIKHA